MTELQSVAAAARRLRAAGQPFLIATVVAVRGSSYRRPGARILIAGDRWITGSVSGGCLEGDLLRRGWWHTGAAPAVVVTYDSTAEDGDPGWGVGFGCNGVVDVLLERGELADGTPNIAVDGLWRAVERATACAVVTVFRSQVEAVPVGARVVIDAGGRVTSIAPSPSTGAPARAARIVRALVAAGQRCFTAGDRLRPSSATLAVGDGAVEALVETLVPPPALFVCGGGRDAVPVTALAGQMGWDITVWEPRRREQVAPRFPQARLVSGGADELVAAVAATPRALAVVMSHDFRLDAEALRVLLPSSVLHIGVLGPRRRTEKLLATLAQEGAPLPVDPWRRLAAPVGLALGAETPEEIALAIVAEAQAVLTGESAGFLRSRPGPVHPPRVSESEARLAVTMLEAAE